MKNLILEIKPKSGMLSELQSDTILGHFCWRLKERFGVEKLNSFIECYKNNNAIFLLSDGLLKSDEQIHFPKPLVFNKPIVHERKKEKIKEFVMRKNNKESKSISSEQLNIFLQSGVISPSIEQQNSITHSSKSTTYEQLRVAVQIDRNSLSSAEGKLFSYSPKYVHEDLTYAILIKVLDEKLFEEFQCEQILKEVFEVGFGKKKSSGYGSFQVLGINPYNEIEEPSDGNAFLVLGNYLPSDQDQADPIGYDINTKYGKFGEDKSQSSNPFKNPIVFLTAGSCLRTTSSSKQFFGRITDLGELSDYHPESVQFGCPFFLRFNYSATQ